MTPTSKLLSGQIALRRAIAVSALLFAGIFLWATVIWPCVHLWESQTQWRKYAKQTVSHDRGLVAIEEEIRKQTAALPQASLFAKLYRNDAEGAAAGTLQADIKQILGSTSATAQTLNPLAAEKLGPITKIGVRISTIMTIDQLKNFLAKVSAHGRYLRIEQMDVAAPSIQAHEQNPNLNISMEIAAFYANNQPKQMPQKLPSQVGAHVG